MTSLYEASIYGRQGRRGGGGSRPNRGDRLPNWGTPNRPGRPGYGSQLGANGRPGVSGPPTNSSGGLASNLYDNVTSQLEQPYNYNSQAHADLINNAATGTPGTGYKGDPNFDPAKLPKPQYQQGPSTTLTPNNPNLPDMPDRPTYNRLPALDGPTPNLAGLTTAGPAATYDPSTYNAANIGVSNNATVSGRLNQLMDEDSYYMQIARQNAMRDVNARGMLNSSMAVSAAQRAAIEAGLPIASQDAATYSQREMNLMNAQNAARQFNAGAFNQAGAFNAGQQNAMSQFNTGQANAMEQFNTGQANTMAQAQWSALQSQRHAENMAHLNTLLTGDQQERMAYINNTWARLLNSDVNTNNLFMSMMDSVNRFASQEGWTQQQQQEMIDNNFSMLEQFAPFMNFINSGSTDQLNGVS